MFGTGTRGFAIITTSISCGTYAIVFGLLHAPSRLSTFDLLKLLRRALWPHKKPGTTLGIHAQLEVMKRPKRLDFGVKPTWRDEKNHQTAQSVEIAAEGTGKERVIDEDKSHAVQDPQTTAKSSVLARLRKEKPHTGDYEQGKSRV